MMKIKLNKRNYPKVIAVLKNIFEKPEKGIITSAKYNYKGFGEAELLAPENITYFRNATSSKHWLIEEKREETPLIHIDFNDGMNYFVLQEGDIVDLKNGSTIIIRQQGKFISEILAKNSLTTLFTSVDLNSIENKLIELEKSREDEKIFLEEELGFDYIEEEENL